MRWIAKHNGRTGGSEPHGHRGHPTQMEKARASHVRERLGATIVALVAEGFTEREALVFIAGIAQGIALAEGEAWHGPAATLNTLQRMLIGYAARGWSLLAIDLALSEVAALLDPAPLDPRRPW